MKNSTHNLLVFPTPVGVFRLSAPGSRRRTCLPHARGGVSARQAPRPVRHGSSPRPWGCFYVFSTDLVRRTVFPTPVGVFLFATAPALPLRRLPHARGGVSEQAVIRWMLETSSPRPWGCFSAFGQYMQKTYVFPTPVGVFLRIFRLGTKKAGLPHARGGVSA